MGKRVRSGTAHHWPRSHRRLGGLGGQICPAPDDSSRAVPRTKDRGTCLSHRFHRRLRLLLPDQLLSHLILDPVEHGSGPGRLERPWLWHFNHRRCRLLERPAVIEGASKVHSLDLFDNDE